MNLGCFGKEKKRKEKETGGAEGPGRATAHFGSFVAKEKFYRDRVSRALCRDRVSCVATGPQVALTTWSGCAHDKVFWLNVATWFSYVATVLPGMLGDLGRDKDFLCCYRALLGPMSQLWTVSRSGVVKAGRPCVATQQMCHGKVAQ